VKGLCDTDVGGRLGAAGAFESATGGFLGAGELRTARGAGGLGATGAVDPSAEVLVVSAGV
jgi:hypothetical protein